MDKVNNKFSEYTEKMMNNFIKGKKQKEFINNKRSEMIMLEFILKIVTMCIDITGNVDCKSQRRIINECKQEIQKRIEEKYYDNIEKYLEEVKQKIKKIEIVTEYSYISNNNGEIKNESIIENKFISNNELNLLKEKILEVYEVLTYINENENIRILAELQSSFDDLVEKGTCLVTKSSIEQNQLKKYYEIINSEINEVIKIILCKI